MHGIRESKLECCGEVTKEVGSVVIQSVGKEVLLVRGSVLSDEDGSGVEGSDVGTV